MLRKIEKFLNAITTPISLFGRKIAGFILLCMTVIVMMQVISRYVFNMPLSWTDEVSRYLMIYMTYLCLPFVYLTDRNISMTFLTDMINARAPRVYHMFVLFGHITAIAIFSLWVKFGWVFFGTGSVMADSIRIPMYFVYIMPPLMMSITCIFALQKSICSIRAILGDFENVSNTDKLDHFIDCKNSDTSDDAAPLTQDV
jgi:TRAP-type C4-dicarboxylate transport system permease small subunit